jgi:hypothetical protein
MLALLRALIEIFLQILVGAIPSFLVALVGGVAVAVLLWLADF